MHLLPQVPLKPNRYYEVTDGVELTHSLRNEIVRDLVTQMFAVNPRPNSAQVARKLVTHVSQTKTNGLKKGLRKQQQILSAKKKEYVSKHLTDTDKLITFLQAEGTLEEVFLGVGHRYVSLVSHKVWDQKCLICTIFLHVFLHVCTCRGEKKVITSSHKAHHQST